MDTSHHSERTYQAIATKLKISDEMVRQTIQTLMDGFKESGLGKRDIGTVNEYIPINNLYKAIQSGKADLRVLEILVDKDQPFRKAISDRINAAHQTHGGPIEDDPDRYMRDITAVYYRVKTLLDQDAKVNEITMPKRSKQWGILTWLRQRV